MESLIKNNVVIKFTDNHMVELNFETEKGKQLKYITFNELVQAMVAAKMNAEDNILQYTDTPVLTNNLDNGVSTIRIREFENGTKYVVLMKKPMKTDINYFDTIYKNVGIPRLLYAIKITGNVVSHVKIVAVKDAVITPDTKLYCYPYSNVNAYDGAVCFGRNRITEVNFESLIDLHSVPSMFHAMPSNNDNYGHNLSGLEHRPLLEALVGKDFNEEWLKPNSRNFNFEQWFQSLN